MKEMGEAGKVSIFIGNQHVVLETNWFGLHAWWIC